MIDRGHPETIIGVDLGKLRDYNAIAVIEHYNVKERWDPVMFCDKWVWRNVIRGLERVELRTSYPRVIERVTAIVSRLLPQGRVAVVVDATGVGQPVVDALRAAKLDCDLVPVTITGGEAAHKAGGVWHVPKQELLVTTQMMLCQGELKIPENLDLAEDLKREMAKMRIDLTTIGKGHDDLVMAVSLAAWRLRTRRTIGEQSIGRIV